MKTEDTQKKSKGVFVTNDQVRLTGSPDVARFLAQCLYWSGIEMVEQRQGWFYKSRDEWQAETWLSRYKQEKAREQLKNMGLLEEFRERRNVGIRLWFRLNRALYNTLLNNLLTVKSTTEQNDSTNLKESLDNISSSISTSIDLDNPIDLLTNCTIVPIKAYKHENGTIVSKNNSVNDDVYSDKHCLTEDVIEVVAESQSGVSVEPIGSPLTLNCDDCTDTEKHSIDVDDYQTCHPFIYQFVKCLVVFNGISEDGSYSTGTQAFIDHGFSSELIMTELHRFIEKNGKPILTWYQKQQLPFDVGPLTRTDLDDAIRISKGCF